MSDQSIGYIKYDGALVKEGILDAKKSAEAFLGIDEVLRYYIKRADPQLAKLDFELPVGVRKGSWEVYIPHDVESFIRAALIIGPGLYAKKALEKMAEHDFDNIGFGTIIKNSMNTIRWMIKIGKHVADMHQKQFENVEFEEGTDNVGIEGVSGDYIWVPRNALDEFSDSSPKVLYKLSSLIAQGRDLVVGVQQDGHYLEERITTVHKHIFTLEDEDLDAPLFPEFTHGLYVKLDGYVTRGTETTNSIGFRYQGHILNCHPIEGSIVEHKPALFSNCTITGLISRQDEHGGQSANKPKILFQTLTPRNSKDSTPPLLPEV